MVEFTGMKVFSATKARERDMLGDALTRWMRDNPNLEIVDKDVRQSSDNEFHCVTIMVYYKEK